ncbi:ABC transporter substrate-binding protein [Streptomyces sp. NBC_00669]|uniref:ABC transporter substrate-binding protein n=1 Tax=Streptomyces sp. NBC_00669 TaxID=2976011 RepID=UPI002E30F149|nr:ABC transporter substrate-binding protein [Streptomyces sp. NBC_00669]
MPPTRSAALSRRHFLGLGTAAAAGAALAACGGPAPNSSGGGGGGGTLRMITPIFDRSDGQKLLESLIADFRKTNPGVTVQPDYTSYSKLNEKLTTSIVGGMPYDVMLIGVGWIPPFAKKGVLADLETSAAELGKVYNSRVVEAGVYDGRTYARPVVLDTRLGIYRKDILAAAGITAPPKDLTELKDMAKELTVRKGGTLQRAGVDILSNDIRQTFLPLMWAFGADLFKDGKPAFDSPEAIDALQWMVDVVRNDRIEDYGFSSTSAVAAPLTQGRAAMAVGHNDLWRQMEAAAPDLIKEDKVAGFTLNQARPAMFQGGTLATVAARSSHREEAKKLVEFLSSAQVSPQAAQQRGNLPAVNSAADSTYVKDDKLVGFAMRNLDHAFSEGGVPSWLEIRDEFKPALESALLGRTTPAKALQGLAEKARAIMAKDA